MSLIKYSIKYIIIVVAISIYCILPSLLFYYIGYQNYSQYNNKSETTCTVIDHEIISDTCPNSCYDGYIIVNYDVNGDKYTNQIEVYSNVDDYNEIDDDLKDNYSIGSEFECLYSKSNPNDVQIHNYGHTIFWILFIILLIISFIVLLIWIGCDLLVCFCGISLCCCFNIV